MSLELSHLEVGLWELGRDGLECVGLEAVSWELEQRTRQRGSKHDANKSAPSQAL